MRAADKRDLRAGAVRLLLLLLAASFALPASASLPPLGRAFGAPEARVPVELGAATTAKRSRASTRSFELFPPRVRAALDRELQSLASPAGFGSRLAGGMGEEAGWIGSNGVATATVGGGGATVDGGGGGGLKGLWTDPVTGMSYARNRWYDARFGAFLSEDPLGDVDSPNLYAFGMHSPFNYSDPMGLCASGDWECYRWVAQEFGNNAVTNRDLWSLGIGSLPIVGDIKDFQEGITGVDLLTGEELSGKEQLLTLGMAFIPIASGKALREGGELTVGVAGRASRFTSEEIVEEFAEAQAGAVARSVDDLGDTQGMMREISTRPMDPEVQAALRRGQEEHALREYPPGFEKEVTLPSGRRMDAYNAEVRQIQELKPDNPQAVRRGEKQLEGYCAECDAVFGPGHVGDVVTYEPKR